MSEQLPERLRRADALRRRWRPDGMSMGERDLQTAERPLAQSEVLDMWARFTDGQAPRWARERVSLYLHALLCPTRCSYCHCTARQPVRKDEREEVLSRILRDIALFAPVVRGLKFRDLYFGGGTPSIFHTAQLERLFDALFSSFDIADDQERAIEMNPANARADKLLLASQAGFNRVSFGIESLTPSVLDAHDRGYQRASKVGRAIEAAHVANFEHVNVDLLVLPGETPETFREVVRQVVGWRPTEIHLYRLQRQSGYTGGDDTMSYRIARDLLEEYGVPAGYEGISPYDDTRVCTRARLPNHKPITRSYRHQSADHGSILGLGPGADSICRFFAQYKDRGYDGDVSTAYWGSRRGFDTEVRHFVLSKMVLGKELDFDEFGTLFGPKAWPIVQDALSDFETAGWLKRKDGIGRWYMDEGWQVVTAGLALTSEAERQHIESKVSFTTPSDVTVDDGAVAHTGWSVDGFDSRFTGWQKLMHQELAPVLFRVERDGGQRGLAQHEGLLVRYHGAELPRGSEEALIAVLHGAAASGSTAP